MDNMEIVTHETTCEEVEIAETVVPFLVYHDETLVEITMVKIVDKNGYWQTVEGETIIENLPGKANRVVIEMPNGCLESFINASEGAEIRFVPGAGTGWWPCQR